MKALPIVCSHAMAFDFLSCLLITFLDDAPVLVNWMPSEHIFPWESPQKVEIFLINKHKLIS